MAGVAIATGLDPVAGAAIQSCLSCFDRASDLRTNPPPLTAL
jgi:hypothetical protein